MEQFQHFGKALKWDTKTYERYPALQHAELVKRYAELFHGQNLHNEINKELLPPPYLDAKAIYDEMREGRELELDDPTAWIPIRITQLKYENFALWLWGVSYQGATIAVEITRYKPHLFIDCPDGCDVTAVEMELNALVKTLVQNNNNAYEHKSQEKCIMVSQTSRTVAPPFIPEDKVPLLQVHFQNWSMLKTVADHLCSGSEDLMARKWKVYQYEQLRLELLFMFEHDIRLHQVRSPSSPRDFSCVVGPRRQECLLFPATRG